MPAVKAALLDVLQAHAGLAALQAAEAVTYGQPAKGLQREHVWLGDARFEQETPRIARTPRPHDESYQLPVIVWTLAEGNDPRATEERMWEIVAAIEDAVRDSPDLGAVANGLHWAVVAGKEPNTWIADGGRGAECAVLVAVHART